jgi:hypothetical protein
MASRMVLEIKNPPKEKAKERRTVEKETESLAMAKGNRKP